MVDEANRVGVCVERSAPDRAERHALGARELFKQVAVLGTELDAGVLRALGWWSPRAARVAREVDRACCRHSRLIKRMARTDQQPREYAESSFTPGGGVGSDRR